MRATSTDAIILHPNRVEIMEEEIRFRRAAEAALREKELPFAGYRKPVYVSPFRVFLQTLLAKYGRASVTNAGHAQWYAFPIQEAVASGLWVVILKTAQKLNLPLDTKSHVVENVAPRVDRMVNAGMALVYGDGRKAAEAFELEVVSPVFTAAKAMPEGQVTLLQDLLQMPTAQFFANLIRQATSYRKHMLAAVGMLKAGNVHPSGLRVLDEIEARNAQIYTHCLRLENADLTLDSSWETVARELDSLKAKIQIQRILLKMPARHTGTQLHMSMENPVPLTVQTHWLNTELLLAAANLPNRGHVDVIAEYRKCVKAIRRTSDATLAKRFFGRLEASGVRLSDEERGLLNEMVRTYAASLRSLPERFPLDFPPAILYRLDAKNPHIDSDMALALALLREGPKLPIDETEDVGRYWASKVEWRLLKTRDIVTMLGNGVVPSDAIARGIAHMPREEQPAAVKALIDSFNQKIDSRTLETLVENRLKKITPIFIRNNLSRLPREVLAKHLPDIVSRCVDPNDPNRKRFDLERLIARMANRLPRKQVREILGAAELRQTMVAIILEAFYEDASRIHHGVSDKKFRRFLGKIGNDLWRRYMLAAELSLRQSTYRATLPEISKDKLYLPPWEDLEDCEYVDFKPSEVFGTSPEEARRLLRGPYTEDKIFLWLHAAEDEPRNLLAKYRQNRERYFDLIKDVPLSERKSP